MPLALVTSETHLTDVVHRSVQITVVSSHHGGPPQDLYTRAKVLGYGNDIMARALYLKESGLSLGHLPKYIVWDYFWEVTFRSVRISRILFGDLIMHK